MAITLSLVIGMDIPIKRLGFLVSLLICFTLPRFSTSFLSLVALNSLTFNRTKFIKDVLHPLGYVELLEAQDTDDFFGILVDFLGSARLPGLVDQTLNFTPEFLILQG